MKIVIVNKHRSRSLGGSEIQCDIIAKGLAAKGHEVFYVSPEPGEGGFGQYDYKLSFCVRNSKSLLNHILSFRPDVVYWRFNKHLFYSVAKGLHRNKTPIIFAVSHLADVVPWSAKKGDSLSMLVARIKSRYQYRAFKYVAALTSQVADHLWIAPVAVQRHIPNAMQSGFVEFDWERPFCLWVANIKPSKQPEKYIELAREFPDLDFLMVGKIQSAKYDYVRCSARLPQNVHYLGEKDPAEVNGMLSRSLFLAHTCEPEGFPNIFIQAWLQGKPTLSLSYDPGGVIESNNLGLYAGGDFCRFKDAARLLIADKTVNERLGGNGLAYAKEEFAVEKLIDSVEDLMFEVVRK